jgi:hypothetical protein
LLPGFQRSVSFRSTEVTCYSPAVSILVRPVDGKWTSSGRLADITRLYQCAWLQLWPLGGAIAAARNGVYEGGGTMSEQQQPGSAVAQRQGLPWSPRATRPTTRLAGRVGTALGDSGPVAMAGQAATAGQAARLPMASRAMPAVMAPVVAAVAALRFPPPMGGPSPPATSDGDGVRAAFEQPLERQL